MGASLQTAQKYLTFPKFGQMDFPQYP